MIAQGTFGDTHALLRSCEELEFATFNGPAVRAEPGITQAGYVTRMTAEAERLRDCDDNPDVAASVALWRGLSRDERRLVARYRVALERALAKPAWRPMFVEDGDGPA